MVILLVLVTATAAFAAWLFSGSGDTTFQNDATVSVSVQSQPTSGSIFPDESENISYLVSHDYDGTLYVADVELGAASTSDGDCASANWISGSGAGADGTAVNGSPTEISVEGLSLASDAPQGCDDSLVTIPATVTLSNEAP